MNLFGFLKNNKNEQLKELQKENETLRNIITKLKTENVELKEGMKITEDKITIFDIPKANRLKYINLSYRGEDVFAGKRKPTKISVNIKQLNALDMEAQIGFTRRHIKWLAENYGISEGTMYRIVYNILSGQFYDILESWRSERLDIDTGDDL